MQGQTSRAQQTKLGKYHLKDIPALECPFALQQLGLKSPHELGNPIGMLQFL